MAHHASALKRHRQSEKKREQNKGSRSKMKTAVKRVRSAATKEEVAAALTTAVSILDRLAAKGIIHKNIAGNQKGKLTRLMNKIPAEAAKS